MGYKYPPGAVRRLDDALLAIFGERYLELHGNAHRADLLAMRLSPQERERAEAFVREQASHPTPPSRGLCYNAMVLP